MSGTNQQISLPEALVQEAAHQATDLGVSTEQWIELALAERLRLDRIDAEYFRMRASRATGLALGEILDQGRDNPPDPGDELPEEWKSS